MRLLIDVGNSLLHIAIYQSQTKIFMINFDSSDSIKKLKQLIKKNVQPFQSKIDSFIFSSVKPELIKLVDFFKKEYTKNHLVINNLLITNLKFDLDDLTTLGSDLLAAAVGAHQLFKNQDMIIINLGTATTIFCIKNGTFIGGAIVPGLITSANNLIVRASLLEQGDWVLPSSLIAKNTFDCLSVGIIYGHVLTIKGFVKCYKKELIKPKIIILGGNYELVKAWVKTYNYQPDLIFNGLNELWNLNKGEQ